MKYDKSLTGTDRINTLFKWIDEDPDLSMITLYFSIVDDAGHRFGPDSPQMDSKLLLLDELLVKLKRGLDERGLYKRANLMIVSDHGLAQAATSSNIEIDRYIPNLKEKILWMDYNTITTIFPKPGCRLRN